MKKLLIVLILTISISSFVRAADDNDDVQCPEGRTYNATVESCVPCRPGTYAPYSENKVCKPCPEGTIAPKQGSGKCYECPAGSYEIGDRLACYKCGRGKYSLARETSCTECPAGSIAPEEGQAEKCTRCSTAFYEVDRRSCQRCPAGYMSPFGSTKDDCYQCPAGSIVGLRAKTSTSSERYECQKCKAGTYEVDRTTCTSCPKGYASTEGSVECTQCAAGSVAAYDGSSCGQCSAGNYEVERRECMKCPDKMTSSKGSSGKASCFPCPPGTSWSESYYSSGWKYGCNECGAGQYDVNRDRCVSNCPSGTYADTSQKTCATCPDGTSSKYGAEECQKCPVGNYGTGGSCSYKCPAGTSSPEGSTNYSQCIACELGSVAQSGSACTKCPAGQIPSWYNKYSCTRCTSGYYQFNVTTCLQCPNGTISQYDGATQCTPCPDGKLSSPGNYQCLTKAEYEKQYPETSTSRGIGINPLFYAVGVAVIALLLFAIVYRRNKKQTHHLNFSEEQASLQAADYQRHHHTYA